MKVIETETIAIHITLIPADNEFDRFMIILPFCSQKIMDKGTSDQWQLNIHSDHTQICEHSNETYPCTLDKRYCRLNWYTTLNDHFLALES
jgi:hypothetical protein